MVKTFKSYREWLINQIKVHFEYGLLEEYNYSNLNLEIKTPKDIKMGDVTIICMPLAGYLKQNPMFIAETLSTHLLMIDKEYLSKIEIIKPGYINIFFNRTSFLKYSI